MSLRVCNNVYLPIRKSPSHRSEMISQILFGERYNVTEKAGNWLRVTTLFDSFTGWIDGTQALSSEWHSGSSGIITANKVNCEKPDRSIVTLYHGSEILDLDIQTGKFNCQEEEWMLLDNPYEVTSGSETTIVDDAIKFLNTPYLWGGRTMAGIDCSGLTQIVFKMHGIALPRNSSDQSLCGEIIDFIEEALPGDILFFSGEGESISHAGILIREGRILHSSGSVRIDTVDHQGIWNEQQGLYTHRLRIIRRVTK